MEQSGVQKQNAASGQGCGGMENNSAIGSMKHSEISLGKKWTARERWSKGKAVIGLMLISFPCTALRRIAFSRSAYYVTRPGEIEAF
jgi:hypothetical protein